ncbi:hypothetical protein MTR67_035569 [Solanum verrucosum]|uniref:Uncharacterized protein n=1 Tax=Solanum verrucosum TaxID=315347 RepID=A0AAF0ZMF4_SOLVR|nr:hypothetical protein MTR67_035569 [Solanum verrucosum]
MGGRLTLINFVLDAMPSYMMSLLPFPASVMKRLDSLRRDFFWEENREKNKIHLVNWESCLTSKKNGGAGIKNLKIHNQSLMMKQIWNFNSDDHPLWKKVIMEKYGLNGRWTTKVSNSPYGVSL